MTVPFDAGKNRPRSRSRLTSPRPAIEFRLSYEQWLEIWQASGKLAERGRGKHQTCMSRRDDKGHYDPSNMFVQTNRPPALSPLCQPGPSFHQQELPGRVLGPETKERMKQPALDVRAFRRAVKSEHDSAPDH